MMRARTAVRVLVIALVAACCVACGAAVAPDKLAGDYQIDYGYGIETLRLTGDGSYLQLFRLAGEEDWTTNSGTWEFSARDKEPKIVLRDSLVADDGAGKLRGEYQIPVPGERALTVKASFGNVQLFVDEGRKLAFKKQG
jgi:hypothetical protein